MRKLLTMTAFCAVLCGFVLYLTRAPAAQAQAQYKIEGWAIKKSWGSMRGNYVDPRTAELRFIFEDTAGTIRIVAITPETKTAVPVVEMRRE